MQNTSQHNASLLVIDNDRLFLATLCLDLRATGFKVYEANNAEEAIDLCKKQQFDLALLDTGIPEFSGIETAKTIKESFQIPLLCLSTDNDDNTVNNAIKHGALGYLVKPIKTNQIIPAIETALIRSTEIKSLLAHHDDLTNALSQSREISVAIGIFMSHTRLSPQQAESALRHYSRSTRQKMTSVAKRIINASEELNTLINAIKLQISDTDNIN